MFRRKWRIAHLISYTRFEILPDKFWTKSGAQRVAKGLNETRPADMGSVMGRLISGDDVFVVRNARELLVMGLDYEMRKTTEAARNRAERGRQRAKEIADTYLHEQFPPAQPEAEVPMRIVDPLPHPLRPIGGNTGRLNRGGPVEKKNVIKGAKITRIDRDGSDDEGTAHWGLGLRGEPRVEAPTPEHNVGRDLPCDVPAQGASGSDRVSDGGYSAGGSSSSDGGSGGSDCSAGSSDSW